MKRWLALITRESGTLAPWWTTFVALVVLTPMLALLLEDGLALRPRSSLLDGMHDTTFIAMLLAFMVGHGLVAHEWRQGHVEFLDGLPVRRGEVYVAKVIAAALPCILLVGGSAVGDLLLSVLVDDPWSQSTLGPILLGHAVVASGAIAGLGMGLLLSWLGGLGWGVLALGMVVAMMLTIIVPPTRTWIPLLGTYGALDWHLGTATHPWGPPIGWTLLGVGCAAASGVLFLGPGSLFTSRGSWLTTISRWGLVGCGGLLLLFLGAISLLGVLMSSMGTLLEPVRALPAGTLRVLYHPSGEGDARALADELDALSRQVGALVGNPDPLQLDVELMSAPSNHAGLFTGGKIRVRADADRFTVAHELAHAHAFALAGASAWRQSTHTRFFDEGLASWVAAQLEGREPVPADAGWIRRTDQARFELLVEDSELQEKQDLAQAYPLGQAFVAALVDEAGDDAPACILEGLREVGARPVAGLALWYRLAERCDFSLDAVIDRWEDRLDARAARLAPPLPRLHARPVREGTALEVTDPAGTDWRLVCRFRDDVSVPVSRYLHLDVWEDGTCPVPTSQLSGQTYDYQLGFLPPGADQPIFWPWVSAPVP